FHSSLPFQVRQDSFPAGGEREQLRLKAPATPEPATTFSGIVIDQAGKAPAPVINFIPENDSLADTTAKTTESQPVVNGRERITATDTNKVNFRGQKLDPALDETHTPPVPRNGEYNSAPGGMDVLLEKEDEPGTSDREQTVPEKVYGKLKLPEGDWQQSTETGITAP
ncbi:MAG: hypothetical protein H5T99_12185, partial [Moorella sp. (in: Bacteria)]|nr:hypothetical protein [Moorella sp. (in: firmicutes)]